MTLLSLIDFIFLDDRLLKHHLYVTPGRGDKNWTFVISRYSVSTGNESRQEGSSSDRKMDDFVPCAPTNYNDNNDIKKHRHLVWSVSFRLILNAFKTLSPLTHMCHFPLSGLTIFVCLFLNTSMPSAD